MEGEREFLPPLPTEELPPLPDEPAPPLPVHTSNLLPEGLDFDRGRGGPQQNSYLKSNSFRKRKTKRCSEYGNPIKILKTDALKFSSEDYFQAPPLPNEPAPPLPMHTSNHQQKGLDFDHGSGGSFHNSAADCPIVHPRSEKLENGNFDQSYQYSDCSGTQDIEYDIIDEIEYTNDDKEDDSALQDNLSDYDSLDDDEIEAMLEESLSYKSQKGGSHGDDDCAPEEREKVVLKVRGQDHFDILPEGWIEVTHNSGMPIYLHRQTRVCTMSKPYFLGPGSARKHEIPIISIPCLHYKRELEKETEEKEHQQKEVAQVNGDSSQDSDGGPKPVIPVVKVETVKEYAKEKCLDAMAVRDYCSKRFEFQVITVRRFKSWADRRKHQKIAKSQQRPTLPSDTKLITCPIPAEKQPGQVPNPRKEFVLNPNGKSSVCILHEYAQHAMRVQPRYIFKELENASTPYSATVVIRDMEYGTGYGTSKKNAKLEAARTTLEILIPQITTVSNDEKTNGDQQDVTFFDEVKVEDLRVFELCAKAGQPSPYQILLECLKRNYGMGDTNLRLDMRNLKHQKNEFIMTVGKHTATVICKNKREGKQRAAQAMLQLLHSHITSYGSLLRLYGKGSYKTIKEKKQEEQTITELQTHACANKPNLSILAKLHEEMRRLHAQRESIKSIGKFKPSNMELPSTSGINNLDL